MDTNANQLTILSVNDLDDFHFQTVDILLMGRYDYRFNGDKKQHNTIVPIRSLRNDAFPIQGEFSLIPGDEGYVGAHVKFELSLTQFWDTSLDGSDYTLATFSEFYRENKTKQEMRVALATFIKTTLDNVGSLHFSPYMGKYMREEDMIYWSAYVETEKNFRRYVKEKFPTAIVLRPETKCFVCQTHTMTTTECGCSVCIPCLHKAEKKECDDDCFMGEYATVCPKCAEEVRGIN